jgi:hypothetical protein
MNLVPILAAYQPPSTGSLLGLLQLVAIICVVAWAIWALIKATGWAIPAFVRIIFVAPVSIVLIILMFKLVAFLL